jgi:hypothetical protein
MSNDNGMTEEEFSMMISLISKYVNNEMDQFESWRFTSRFGDPFVNISLYAEGDGSAYTDVSKAIKKTSESSAYNKPLKQDF